MSRTRGHRHPSSCKTRKPWKHGLAKGSEVATAHDKRAAEAARQQVSEIGAPCVACGRQECPPLRCLYACMECGSEFCDLFDCVYSEAA